ncbi:MAG TPA: aspartate--tRNA(Asn) ligase [Candidatus Paceibacterota bacterium]|nr:aspartate--tRNA(Asn) ligase [Candidatus Paceibacterota bacterium]
MERTLIGDLGQHIGEKVSISAWVDVARNQGKMAFFDFRDRSGKVQGVVFGKPEVLEVAQTLKQEWVVRIEGVVNERPEKMRRDVPNGNIELEITAIEVLSEAHSLPFDMNPEQLNIDTHFDNLPLTLRLERTRDIFTVQATIVDAFRNALKSEGFTEFQAPVLVGGDAEGGAAVFKIEDYYGKQAYLATSGQLYKQIMVGPFERSMTVAKTFRAEKSATTRHLAELTQLEFEMGFIESHKDVMAMLEKVIRSIASAVTDKHADALKRFKVEPAALPQEEFPVFMLREAQEIIEKEFGGKAVGELDLEPEHERQICQYAKEKFGSDFVFITHFPTKKRAFYTFADPENPEFSRSFDLLFRGLEINSGSQRIHNYDELIEKMKSRSMDPAKFAFYLQAFKYGMPPHGGCSTGLERITMKMLDLSNVKEASAFPRDMNRIDILLSTDKKEG